MEGQFAFFKMELKSLLREPISIFFMLVLPIILTIVFGGAFGNERTQYGENVLGIDTVVPVNIVFLLANAGLLGISITIIELKEQGVLKRYSTYPISLRSYFISLVLTFSLVTIVSTILFLSLSFVVYNASFYMNATEVLMFLILFIWITLIFYSTGFLIALFTKSTRTANFIATGVFLAMLFTSGVVLPLDSLPDYVQTGAKLFPMSHSIEVMQMLWIGQLTLSDSLHHIVYLAVVGVLLLLSLRFIKIRWD